MATQKASLSLISIVLSMGLLNAPQDVQPNVGAVLRDESGKRPVDGGTAKFQQDPHWRDNILFYEDFHGDNGAGLGASHQTGWTGLVSKLIQLFHRLDAKQLLISGKEGAFRKRDPEREIHVNVA